MITLRNISKSFGAQTLFEDISLQINERDRFALVGPNGAGKSTLFKLIMGQDVPDSGEVALRSGVRFGYLPQETAAILGKQVLEEVLEGDFSNNRREAQAKKILMGLGFKITDFTRLTSELSGGWQMRVMIAKLLLEEPDLLMLDEPTNHLDLESLLWFQNYLQNYRGALFLISHDRDFINAITDRIVEVDQHKLKVYTGSFESYQEQKKQEAERLLSAYKLQQKEIKDLEEFISRFRAKASLAASVQSKIKYLDRMKRIELPPDQDTVGFSFPQPKRSGHNVLVLKDIRQSYDGKRWIYNGLDLTIERGQKIVLVGPNGAGKSTLLKMLAGNLAFQSGERKLGFEVEIGYFSQHRAEMFRPERTVFQEACDTRRAHSETNIRTILGSFLFRGEAVNKKVEVLSGGEKSRLGLARLLLDPPNFILMDEPTTHLDMASVQVLIEALRRFEGTICFISHDVYFIRNIANSVIHVNDGKITWYPGAYDDFMHKKSLEEGEEAELFRAEERIEASHKNSSPSKEEKQSSKENLGESGNKSGRKSKEQKRREAEERNARYRQSLDQKKQGDAAKTLEQEQAEIVEKLSHLDNSSEEIKKMSLRLAEIQKELENSSS
jgi:ATP-binding cassette subfamily F protein 3